jgi:hypothetical protein
MKSATSIGSNRVEDVCAALGAPKLTTCGNEPGSVGRCHRAAVGKIALASKLFFRTLNHSEIVVTPCLRVWAGTNTSDKQQWNQAQEWKAN